MYVKKTSISTVNLSSTVVGDVLWVAVSRGLPRVSQGNAPGQHPSEPAGMRPDRDQVPRTARHHGSHRGLRIFQELRRYGAS